MRRMWMLLLVVTLMVIALAIPAMAAEDHGEWTELTSGTTDLAEGNYYLAGDIEASVTVTEGDVVICLHGHTWSGVDARPLTITGGSVTICDCEYVAPAVDLEAGTVSAAQGGVLQGYQYSGVAGEGDGGAVHVASGATFTLQSGTITGGKACNGGNIYAEGAVAISGGIIRDGVAGTYDASTNTYVSANKGWGGNILTATSGSVNMTDGIVSGGSAGGNGGNIRFHNSTATVMFTMSGGTIIGGDSRDNGGNLMIQGAATLSGGVITAGTAKQGGNISINAARNVKLSGVQITNGASCGTANANSQYNNGALALNNNGGNVIVFNNAATLTIDGGTVISGGLSTAGSYRKNLYVNKASTKLNLGTCQIDGYVQVIASCTINVSGAPVIAAGDTNLYTGSAMTIGTMTGGNVGVTTASGKPVVISGAFNTPAYESYFFADKDTLAVTYDYRDDKLYLADAYCVCGASKNGGEHKSGCDETLLGWRPWNDTTKLPAGHGNFYLNVEQITASTQYKPEQYATMRLDLNGCVVTNETSRTYATATSTGGDVKMWITDTKGGGKLACTASSTGQGMILRICARSSLTLIAGTIDASGTTTTHATTGGAAICVESGCTFNMYGGSILGGTAPIGGAVSCTGTSTFNMHGGSITEGNAGAGNAIHAMGAVKLTIKGQILEGTANNGVEAVLAQGNFTLGEDVDLFNVVKADTYNHLYLTADDAIAAVEDGEHIELTSDLDGVTITKNLYVDLNGKSLTGTAADGVEVRLFDSTAANYTPGTGSAAITGGTVVADFLTGELDSYGPNYRFLTIQDAEGNYSSHRIRLSVTSTDLLPGAKPTVKHSIILRCDSKLAELLNNGGTYGLTLTYEGEDADFSKDNYEVKAYDAENGVENALRFGVTNILTGDNAQQYGEGTMSAKAFMTFTDEYGIVHNIKSASSSSRSLKEMVGRVDSAVADAAQLATMSAELQAKLVEMYNTWSEKMTEWGWSISNLATLAAE